MSVEFGCSFLHVWISRTAVPPCRAVLTGAAVSPGRMWCSSSVVQIWDTGRPDTAQTLPHSRWNSHVVHAVVQGVAVPVSSRALPCQGADTRLGGRACRVRIMFSCHLLANCHRVCLSALSVSLLPCPVLVAVCHPGEISGAVGGLGWARWGIGEEGAGVGTSLLGIPQGVGVRCYTRAGFLQWGGHHCWALGMSQEHETPGSSENHLMDVGSKRAGTISPCQRGSGVWAAAGRVSWPILVQGEAAPEGNPRAMQWRQNEPTWSHLCSVEWSSYTWWVAGLLQSSFWNKWKKHYKALFKALLKDSHLKNCQHLSVSPLQEENTLPSLLRSEIVALERSRFVKNAVQVGGQ